MPRRTTVCRLWRRSNSAATSRGGLVQVVVALDQQLNREVAMKQIQSGSRMSCSTTQVLLEATLKVSLEHPGIVPVYSLGQTADGLPFYAMRFIRARASDRNHCSIQDGDRKERGPGAGLLS